MRAAIRERYGPPEVVEVREVDTPTPRDDEVLVRVRAASVNRADLDYLGPRPGFIRPMIGMRAPRDPRMGIDAAGVVESVGADGTINTIEGNSSDKVSTRSYPPGSRPAIGYVRLG